MTSNGTDLAEVDQEFTNYRVPLDRRRSFVTVAGTWFGYPTSITNTVFGGVIVAYLGLQAGLLAILVGTILLFGYVGALSYDAGRTGRNFPLQTGAVFGTRGYQVIIALLATTGIGWFAYQTGLTGKTISGAFGLNDTLATFVAGVFYVVLVLLGVRAIGVIGWLSAPLFLILSAVAIGLAVQESSISAILNFTPSTDPALDVFSVGIAISVVFGAFSDAGTMTADVTRWGRTGKQSLWAAFTAFPVADFIGYAVGGVIVATGLVAQPISDGGNFMPFLVGNNIYLSVVLFLFVFINLGASCSHCLYNGVITWSNISKVSAAKMTILIGAAGTVAALAGIWGTFLYWLNILGIVIPPVGTIMIMHLLVFRRRRAVEATARWRAWSFTTWGAASGASLATYFLMPRLSYAVIGVLVACAMYVPRLWLEVRAGRTHDAVGQTAGT